MNGHINRNYLRSNRIKMGLNQGELASIVGHKSGWRISALESGRAKPTAQEIVIFSLLFHQTFEDLYPNWTRKIVIDLHARIRRLMDRIQRSQSGSKPRSNRAVFVLKNLESFLERLPKE